MSKFQIGTKVLHLDSGQHGTVIEVMPPRRGRQFYSVSWPNGISDELEVSLVLDCDISNPFERCANGIFGAFWYYASCSGVK